LLAAGNGAVPESQIRNPEFVGKDGKYLQATRRVGRSLQDSDSKGRRYVNDKVRSQARAKQRREEFLKELEQIRAGPSQAFLETPIPNLEFGNEGEERLDPHVPPPQQGQERESG
jgi:hypothetical protein